MEYSEEYEKHRDDNQDILTEIRENFQYACDAWREIREEAKVDMRFVSGDSWDPSERARREDPKGSRPCLSLDELGQYTNQVINDVRQAKRGILVIPRGNGANDKEAELRGNIIRDIEYESNAQAAYITAFENTLQRSYGALRINTCPIFAGKKEQKIVIRRIANPDTVYPDPDYREADGSDMGWLFVIDFMSKRKFQREFPDALVKNFTADEQISMPQWVKPNHIQVAEYWRVKKEKKGPPSVCQYITNGMEILEKTDWLGRYIPIIVFPGKELWMDDGGGSRRIWESLIRKARDPQQLCNYYASTEAEVIRMVPKSPFVAPIGSFNNREETWQHANDTPVAYLEYDPYPNGVTGSPFGAPQRPQYDPPIQAMEIGKESARRSIQAAMGISPLPTEAQRRNEKSGIALKRIQDETQKGSFHFVDNYERGLMFVGRQVNDLLAKVYDTARDVGVRHKDETHHVIKLNQPSMNEDGDAVNYELTDGEYDVTISTGPSYESEREQANEFVEMLLPELPGLPLDQPVKAQLLALALKLKNLGPIGEEMAELISPKNTQMPPQAQAALQKLQQELQLAQGTITQLMQEKVAKHAELQNKLDVARIDNDTKVLIAEINTKAQSAIERDQMYKEVWQEVHNAAHEVGLQAMQQGSQQQMAQQAQAHEADQNSQQQAADAQQAAQAQQEPATVGA